jgi:hypothetical protein
MKTTKVSVRLTNDERETVFYYSLSDKQWVMDSTIPRHFNKAKKQGWVPIEELVYDDGLVCGMVLSAPDGAITIRNPYKKRSGFGGKKSEDDDDDE